MKTIVYNLANLRSPITGIGRYALELAINELSQGRSVAGYINGQLEEGPALGVAAQRLKNSTANNGQRQRAWIGHIPLARRTYQTIQAKRFSRAVQNINFSEALTHNTTYSGSWGRPFDVTTVFDVSHLLVSSTHPAHRVVFLKRFFRGLELHDKPIITISQSVKDELCAHYSFDPQRIHVTPLAADPTFRPLSAEVCQPTLSRFGLSEKSFILSVGTLEPRKNLSAVLAAYARLSKEIRAQVPLVLVGPQGWKSADLQKKISQLASSGCLKQLGYVSNDDLPALYSSASAFCYPSLYEGFGLPVLEAMQCGCPCITSNNGALQELANDAAVTIDPQNQDELYDELHKVLHDQTHAEHLRHRGTARAAQFNWQATAAKSRVVYDSI